MLNSLSVLAISTTFLFGMVAVFLSLQLDRLRKIQAFQEKNLDEKHYEVSVSKELQDRLGYEFSAEQIVSVVIGNLRSLFSFTSASYVILKQHHISYTAYSEEQTSHQYQKQVKERLFTSLATLGLTNVSQVEESYTGITSDDTGSKTIGSYFHVPLYMNSQLIGIVSITSKQPLNFTRTQMQLVFHTLRHALAALSNFDHVLSTEKEKLMSMIVSLPDGVFMLNLNRELMVINQAAREFLMLTNPQPSIIDIFSTIPRVYEFGGKIDEAIVKNKRIDIPEMQLGEKIFQVAITPVLNPQRVSAPSPVWKEPPVMGVAVLFHDITLEKSIAKLKEDFTNIMVHELRSPLTAIKAAAQLLVLDDEKLKKEEKDKILHLIDEQAKKLLDEIGLILDAAKLESGMFQIHKSKGDVKALVDEKVTFYKAQAESKKIELVADIAHDIPLINFDQTYIGQVLNNLISNSMKFTPLGGKIIIRAIKEEKYIRLSVSDNGMGIAKDKQKLLFKRFQQVHNQNATAGTGLGLYIVKGIIEAHGGQILLESELGHGTTISFTLPILDIALGQQAYTPVSLQNAVN